MSPEGIILSYCVPQKCTQETQQLQGQEDVSGAWDLQPPSEGWLVVVKRGDQELIYLSSPVKSLHLTNSIWVLGFDGSGYTYLREKLEIFIILLLNKNETNEKNNNNETIHFWILCWGRYTFSFISYPLYSMISLRQGFSTSAVLVFWAGSSLWWWLSCAL